MSLRDQILSASDLVFEEVKVPEWGVSIWVRTLTAGERDQFEAMVFASKDDGAKVNYRSALVALCAVDADHNRIFSESDIAELAKKSAKAVSRVYDAATNVNLITAEDQKELEKN